MKLASKGKTEVSGAILETYFTIGDAQIVPFFS